MSNQGKVSIIIPYYNCEEFITDCLNSVISQTYRNIEIIIINDGSDEENTRVIESLIRELNDERIRYIKNETRKGVAFSRNKGLEMSVGEYIYFLDSDDFLAENAIEQLVEHINGFSFIVGKRKTFLRPVQLDDETIPNNERQDPEVVVYEVRRWKKFYQKSILNVLIRKDFIEEHHLSFSDQTEGESDLSFIIPLVLSAQAVPYYPVITYFKRVRNDPISNPSISQRPIQEKLADFISVYKSLNDQYGHVEEAKKYLDKLWMAFFRRKIFILFADEEQRTKNFSLLAETSKLLNKNIIVRQPIHTKKQLKYLINNDFERFIKMTTLHKETKRLIKAFRSMTKLKRYIYRKFFTKLSVKENYVVFESFLGKNYSDSPKYIYEYMVNEELPFKYIWIFNDKKKKIPGNAKIIKRFSLAYYYYIAKSKYWVNNMRQPLHYIKKDGQVFLETWHGTPLKKLVFDMKDVYSANPRYKQNFYKQSRAWDYLISPNQYSSEIFRRAFKFEKEMLEFGYPRNDPLYASDREMRAEKIKEQLGIPKDKKVILYAPTWRDDEFYEPGKYKFDLKLDLRKMKKELGKDYVVALRMHYFIADDLNLEGAEGFAFNLSKYDDIADLYIISDILITDYSSVFFDYANLKRPILFYAYDLHKYRDQLRGFYIDYEKEIPGPILKTSDEIIDAIKNIEQIQKSYASLYNDFYKKFCSWHDGQASKKIVEKVFLEDMNQK